MAYDDVNANVVLTANTTQYDQSMQASAQTTDQLAQTIDTLVGKMDKLTKSAGRKLVTFAAVDAAAITGATVAWAAYEKQISRLHAQAAITTRTQTEQTRSLETYKKAVTSLRSEFGTTTSEAAQLTQTLAKMSDHTASINSLAKTFGMMSQATGESSTGLAQSLLGLQKVMGTPQRNTKEYADQLTTLAAGANTTATALGEFASQIAPIGRTVGMTQTEITGVSQAFIKAGQDGYSAATAFNKIMSEIAYNTSSGSPDLAKYSNLIGVTVDQFKQMGGAEKAVKIFEQLNSMGPRAVTELNRLGFDGVRMVKAITAMSQQTGGLGASIREAQDAYGSGSTKRGGEAAMKGVTDDLAKLRQELQMTAEAFGSMFGPAFSKTLEGLTKFASLIREIAEGPVGKLVGVIGGLAGAVAGLGGGLLLAAPLLLKLAAGFGLWRSSFALGAREGRLGPQARIQRDPTGGPGFIGGGGDQGARIAAGGNWYQRYMYNAGVGAREVGQGAGRMFSNAGIMNRPGGGTGMISSFISPRDAAGNRLGLGGRVSALASAPLYMAAAAGRGLVVPQFDTLRFGPDDPRRSRMFRSQYFPGTGPAYEASAARRAAEGTASTTRDVYESARQSGDKSAERRAKVADQQAQKDLTAAKAAEQAAHAKAKADIEAARVTRTAAGETRSFGNGLRAMSRMTTDVVKGFDATARASMKAAASAGVTAAGAGLKSAGAGLMGALGGPWGLALTAAAVGIPMLAGSGNKLPGEKDFSQPGADWMAKAGMEPRGIFSPTYNPAQNTTKAEAARATAADKAYAESNLYKPTEKRLKGLSNKEAKAFLSSTFSLWGKNPEVRKGLQLDLLSYGMEPKEVNAIFTDLDAGYEAKLSDFLSGSWNKGDKTDMTRSIDLAMDVSAQQTSQTFDDSGALAGLRDQAKRRANILGKVAGSRDTGTAERLKGALPDWIYKTPEQTALDKLGKDYFGGASSKELERVFYEDTAGLTGSTGKQGPARGFVKDLETATTPKEISSAYGDLLTQMKKVQKTEVYETGAKDVLKGLGISSSQIKSTDPEKLEKLIYKALTEKAEDERSAEQKKADQIASTGELGKSFADSLLKGPLSKLLTEGGAEDPVLQQQAAEKAYQDALKRGPRRGAKELDAIMAQYEGEEGNVGWAAARQAQLRLRAGQDMKIAMAANPTEAFRMTLAQQGDILGGKDPSRSSVEDRNAAKDKIVSSVFEQAQYLKQQIMAQRQFELQKDRAEDDFALQQRYNAADFARQRAYAYQDFNMQRKFAEQDFAIMRQRAEEDYQRQRKRGVYEFNLSQKRGSDDFYLSRKRQEEDYQHSVVLMTENAAKQMMDIYKRVQVQQTSSATWLLVNSQDQTKRMREQEANLEKLRKAGLGDDAIQQLGLTDSNNAQQLARFVSEVANDPSMVKKFNEQVGERLKSAGKLVTDESSTEWEEFQRSYRLNRDRASQDFRKTVQRSHQDFRRQMREMDEDFRRSMRQQGDDFERAQDRQMKMFGIQMARAAKEYGIGVSRMQEQFHKSMKRAQEDMDLLARGVSGNIKEVFVKATRELKGEQRKQAEGALETLNNLDSVMDKQGRQILRTMSRIFGFDLDLPKAVHKNYSLNNPEPSMPGGPHIRPENNAAGGVLPGFTPGRDTIHYKSADAAAPDLNLSGGEAIMVPEWTKAVGGVGVVHEMNRRARGHRFASGGTYENPDRRVYADGEPLSAISKAQMLLAERLGRMNLSVMQGSWQPHTSYSGSSHMGPGVMDTSPGNFDAQYWLRRVGFAAWGRNFPGAASAGSGAHVHSVSRLDPGARGHAQLSSFARGEDGLGGRDYGPNPPVLPGIMTLLNQFANLVLSDGSASSVPSFGEISSEIYPNIERALAPLSQGLMQRKHGDMSKLFNRYAKAKYDKLMKRYGATAFGSSGGAGSGGAAPSGEGSNQDIVRQAMRNFGWNQWPDLYELVQHESGFRNTAQNPTSSAYGMFQFLDSTWSGVGGHKTADPALQALYGMRYIKSRYGSPSKAWDFWQSHHWYGDGAVFDTPQMIGVGDRGPELVLPLQDRGMNFLVNLMEKYSSGINGKKFNVRGSTPAAQAGAVYNYQIDKSTTFTGAISVTAQNPNELIAKLQARQRQQALSQPALARSA